MGAIKLVKGEDWKATAATSLYSTPDTGSSKVAAIPAGTVIRTIVEANGDRDGGSWRLTEYGGKLGWFRYRTAAGVVGVWAPLVQNGEPAVDQGLTDYIARKWPAIATQPPPTTTPPPTTEPPPTGATYTFEDDFTKPGLDLTKWGYHYRPAGSGTWDHALATVPGDGLLHLRVEKRGTVWYASSVDTKTLFTQKYGIFEARIKIPKGRGLWPAGPWGYLDATSEEIDGMEILANPVGSRDATHDVRCLHCTVHYGGSNQDASAIQTGIDLSADFHVYGYEWRSSKLTWLFDGAVVKTVTDTARIPDVALPVIVDLGVGGSWAGEPDATTPSPSEMLVDWVRVRA